MNDGAALLQRGRRRGMDSLAVERHDVDGDREHGADEQRQIDYGVSFVHENETSSIPTFFKSSSSSMASPRSAF